MSENSMPEESKAGESGAARPWVRRPRIAGAAAGVLAAAVIAAAVFLIVRPTVPQSRYGSLPGQSCALVNAAHVAKYLPGAKGTPVSAGSYPKAGVGICKWSITTDGENRSLVAEAEIFRSAAAVSQAQQAYRASLSAFGCHCQGVTVSTKPVTGLGDQAVQAFIVAGPTANFRTAPVAQSPGASLVVQSSNAVIGIKLDTADTVTGLSLTSPPSPALVAGMITMARDVLAVLVRPASAVAPPSSSLAAEPRYAGRPDPCRMVRAATLATYVPGTTIAPETGQPAGKTAATGTSSCGWGSEDLGAHLAVSTYSGAVAAQQRFLADEGALSISNQVIGVTGMRWLNGLGEGALASVRHQNTEGLVDVIAWSGNAEVDVSYSDLAPGATSPARTARLLAGATAMARDSLAALADPAAAAVPREPSYANPDDACRLVSASTLARYAPGAGAGESGGTVGSADLGENGEQTCAWYPSTGNLHLQVTTYASIDDAQAGLQADIKFARQLPDETVTGAREVTGLGEQATAVFEVYAGSRTVELVARSGNAVIDVSYGDPAFPPELTRDGKLAADIAIARDVLAGLRRT